MNTEKKILLENFISLTTLQVVSYIIPFLSLPYLSRVLGAEKFGIVFFALAFIQYFVILTDYGFDLSATREVAVNRHNISNLSNIFNAVYVIKILLSCISFIILCLILVFVPKLQTNWLIFIFSFFTVIGNALFPTWFFRGMEKMKYITFINICSKFTFLLFIFIFVKQESDYLIVPLFNSLGFVVAGIAGYIFAIKNFQLKIYIPKWNFIIKQFKYSSSFFFFFLSVSAYTNTNTFCLGLINLNSLVGYYVAAEQFYKAISALSEPINTTLYPHVAKYRNITLYKKIFYSVVILNTIVCISTFCFAPYIVKIFYGNNMLPSVGILRIFCIGNLITIPHMLLGYPLLGSIGYIKEVNYSVIIPALVHILALIIMFMTNNINIYKVAFLAIFTEYFVFSLRLYWVKKYKLFALNT